MAKSIKHQIFFPHPQETVWEYLTKPELMELWLMKNNFQPVLGADFQFQTGPIASLNFDGIVYCKVLEFEPVKKLSYSWRGGPGDGEITLDTVVIWRLEQKSKGTELSLEHTGFGQKEHPDFFHGMNNGWSQLLQKIAQYLKDSRNDSTKA